MANRKPTKQEIQYLSDMTDYINEVGLGVLYHGYEGRTDMQRHHVLGKSAKHNKQHIGYYFINPIPFELHDPNVNHKFHVGNCKKAFVKEFGRQCDIHHMLVNGMAEYGYPVPPVDILEAILDTCA